MYRKPEVRVVARFRPLSADEMGNYADKDAVPLCAVYDSQCVEVLERFDARKNPPSSRLPSSQSTPLDTFNNKSQSAFDMSKEFTVDEVFSVDATQEYLYERVGRPVVNNVVQGYNGTLIAYGQTGSGKTHSMFGPQGGTVNVFTPDDADPDFYAHRGLIPRIVEELIAQLNEYDEAERTWTMHVSIFEIYKEEIMDLLAKQRPKSSRSGSAMPPPKIDYRIREDVVGGKGIYVESLETIEAHTTLEVLELIKTAMTRRRTASTNSNETSSRSHSLVCITVEQRDHTAAPGGATITSRLNLVDLAGSEKLSKTHANGERLREAQTINLSLALLGNVIHKLTDGKSGYVPYRDSKLTRILQESLGGNSLTTLLCHCSVAMCNREETLSTMRFAQRAKRVRNKPRVNRELTVNELRLQLAASLQRITVLEQKLQVSNELHHATITKQKQHRVESEGNMKSVIASLMKEVEELREEIQLKAEELVHEKDRVDFYKKESAKLAAELEVTNRRQQRAQDALNEALSKANEDNCALLAQLEDLKKELATSIQYASTRDADHKQAEHEKELEADAEKRRRQMARAQSRHKMTQKDLSEDFVAILVEARLEKLEAERAKERVGCEKQTQATDDTERAKGSDATTSLLEPRALPQPPVGPPTHTPPRPGAACATCGKQLVETPPTQQLQQQQEEEVHAMKTQHTRHAWTMTDFAYHSHEHDGDINAQLHHHSRMSGANASDSLAEFAIIRGQSFEQQQMSEQAQVHMRQLGTDEVARTLHVAGELLSSIANSPSNVNGSPALPDVSSISGLSRITLQSRSNGGGVDVMRAVEVLEHVLRVITEAIQKDAVLADGASKDMGGEKMMIGNMRVAQSELENALQVSERVLQMWRQSNGALSPAALMETEWAATQQQQQQQQRTSTNAEKDPPSSACVNIDYSEDNKLRQNARKAQRPMTEEELAMLQREEGRLVQHDIEALCRRLDAVAALEEGNVCGRNTLTGCKEMKRICADGNALTTEGVGMDNLPSALLRAVAACERTASLCASEVNNSTTSSNDGTSRCGSRRVVVEQHLERLASHLESQSQQHMQTLSSALERMVKSTHESFKVLSTQMEADRIAELQSQLVVQVEKGLCGAVAQAKQRGEPASVLALATITDGLEQHAVCELQALYKEQQERRGAHHEQLLRELKSESKAQCQGLADKMHAAINSALAALCQELSGSSNNSKGGTFAGGALHKMNPKEVENLRALLEEHAHRAAGSSCVAQHKHITREVRRLTHCQQDSDAAADARTVASLKAIVEASVQQTLGKMHLLALHAQSPLDVAQAASSSSQAEEFQSPHEDDTTIMQYHNRAGAGAREAGVSSPSHLSAAALEELTEQLQLLSPYALSSHVIPASTTGKHAHPPQQQQQGPRGRSPLKILPPMLTLSPEVLQRLSVQLEASREHKQAPPPSRFSTTSPVQRVHTSRDQRGAFLEKAHQLIIAATAAHAIHSGPSPGAPSRDAAALNVVQAEVRKAAQQTIDSMAVRVPETLIAYERQQASALESSRDTIFGHLTSALPTSNVEGHHHHSITTDGSVASEFMQGLSAQQREAVMLAAKTMMEGVSQALELGQVDLQRELQAAMVSEQRRHETGLPLCLTTADIAALFASLRAYALEEVKGAVARGANVPLSATDLEGVKARVYASSAGPIAEAVELQRQRQDEQRKAAVEQLRDAVSLARGNMASAAEEAVQASLATLARELQGDEIKKTGGAERLVALGVSSDKAQDVCQALEKLAAVEIGSLLAAYSAGADSGVEALTAKQNKIALETDLATCTALQTISAETVNGMVARLNRLNTTESATAEAISHKGKLPDSDALGYATAVFDEPHMRDYLISDVAACAAQGTLLRDIVVAELIKDLATAEQERLAKALHSKGCSSPSKQLLSTEAALTNPFMVRETAAKLHQLRTIAEQVQTLSQLTPSPVVELCQRQQQQQKKRDGAALSNSSSNIRAEGGEYALSTRMMGDAMDGQDPTAEIITSSAYAAPSQTGVEQLTARLSALPAEDLQHISRRLQIATIQQVSPEVQQESAAAALRAVGEYLSRMHQAGAPAQLTTARIDAAIDPIVLNTALESVRGALGAAAATTPLKKSSAVGDSGGTSTGRSPTKMTSLQQQRAGLTVSASEEETVDKLLGTMSPASTALSPSSPNGVHSLQAVTGLPAPPTRTDSVDRAEEEQGTKLRVLCQAIEHAHAENVASRKHKSNVEKEEEEGRGNHGGARKLHMMVLRPTEHAMGHRYSAIDADEANVVTASFALASFPFNESSHLSSVSPKRRQTSRLNNSSSSGGGDVAVKGGAMASASPALSDLQYVAALEGIQLTIRQAVQDGMETHAGAMQRAMHLLEAMMRTSQMVAAQQRLAERPRAGSRPLLQREQVGASELTSGETVNPRRVSSMVNPYEIVGPSLRLATLMDEYLVGEEEVGRAQYVVREAAESAAGRVVVLPDTDCAGDGKPSTSAGSEVEFHSCSTLSSRDVANIQASLLTLEHAVGRVAAASREQVLKPYTETSPDAALLAIIAGEQGKGRDGATPEVLQHAEMVIWALQSLASALHSTDETAAVAVAGTSGTVATHNSTCVDNKRGFQQLSRLQYYATGDGNNVEGLEERSLLPQVQGAITALNALVRLATGDDEATKEADPEVVEALRFLDDDNVRDALQDLEQAHRVGWVVLKPRIMSPTSVSVSDAFVVASRSSAGETNATGNTTDTTSRHSAMCMTEVMAPMLTLIGTGASFSPGTGTNSSGKIQQSPLKHRTSKCVTLLDAVLYEKEQQQRQQQQQGNGGRPSSFVSNGNFTGAAMLVPVSAPANSGVAAASQSWQQQQPAVKEVRETGTVTDINSRTTTEEAFKILSSNTEDKGNSRMVVVQQAQVRELATAQRELAAYREVVQDALKLLGSPHARGGDEEEPDAPPEDAMAALHRLRCEISFYKKAEEPSLRREVDLRQRELAGIHDAMLELQALVAQAEATTAEAALAASARASSEGNTGMHREARSSMPDALRVSVYDHDQQQHPQQFLDASSHWDGDASLLGGASSRHQRKNAHRRGSVCPSLNTSGLAERSVLQCISSPLSRPKPASARGGSAGVTTTTRQPRCIESLDTLSKIPTSSRSMRLDGAALGHASAVTSNALNMMSAGTSGASSSGGVTLQQTKADSATVQARDTVMATWTWVQTQCATYSELLKAYRDSLQRAERLDELLDKSRNERDDSRQELDALKLLLDALRKENDNMRRVLRDLNINLEEYMANLAKQTTLNAKLREEAESFKGKVALLRTTAEQQEFCEMGVVELAMKAEDLTEVEETLRQVLTYHDEELIQKKRERLGRSVQSIRKFTRKMLNMLQAQTRFNTGNLESQRLNLLQGAAELLVRIDEAEDELNTQLERKRLGLGR